MLRKISTWSCLGIRRQDIQIGNKSFERVEQGRYWGTLWRSRLRHCTAIRKVASLITDDVILPRISNRDLPCGIIGGRCAGLTTLPLSCADYLDILGA